MLFCWNNNILALRLNIFIERPDTRLKLMAHVAKILSARSLA